MNWKGLLQTGKESKFLRIARPVLVVAVVVYLAYEMRDIDWRQVRAGLPATPLFYALLVVVYCMLPVSQVIIYRILWKFEILSSIPAFIRKRILNKDILGYSGEVYIYSWAVQRLGLPAGSALKDVRDQNIVSSAASTSMSLILLAVFLYSGQLSVADIVGESRATALWVGMAVLMVLAVLVLRFRKYVFAMPGRKAAPIFSIHVARLLIRQTLEILMWSLALPEVPIQTWFTYAAASLIITRIPFLPSTDLVLMGVAVGLSEVVGVPEAEIFALFGAIAVVNRVLNLLLFAGLAALERQPVSVVEV